MFKGESQVGCQTDLNLSRREMSLVFQKSTGKVVQSPCCFPVKQKVKKRRTPNVNLSFSKNDLSDTFPQQESHIQTCLCADLSSQAHQRLALIEDTLWKKVCVDVAKTMGQFSILILWNNRLGELSHHDKVADIFCQTEDAARFLKEYAFVILGSLRQYFPALKGIRSRKNWK